MIVNSMMRSGRTRGETRRLAATEGWQAGGDGSIPQFMTTPVGDEPEEAVSGEGEPQGAPPDEGVGEGPTIPPGDGGEKATASHPSSKRRPPKGASHPPRQPTRPLAARSLLPTYTNWQPSSRHPMLRQLSRTAQEAMIGFASALRTSDSSEGGATRGSLSA